MGQNLTESLYQDYLSERSIELNPEQFSYVINLFPALLVVLSDGIVDGGEWAIVNKLASIIGTEFELDEEGRNIEEQLTNTYRNEFKYLLENWEKWEKRFLQALKEQFENNDNSKEFVIETMNLFANASEGISTKERETIDYISRELNL